MKAAKAPIENYNCLSAQQRCFGDSKWTLGSKHL